MYHRILVALSLEHGISERALENARALAAEGASIRAVHVIEPPNPAVRAYLDADLVAKARADAEARLRARVADAPGGEPVLLSGHSSRALTEYATDMGIDLIIVGSHRPGLSDYFLGTTAARVVRHAPCTVMVLR
ncbi:universal stress protein [Ruegeria pomeroyi]|uniref:universal stress protein n=1 Tax=Ruegeria pomeroyi TaxID=89184 RepID=UPI001F30F929|nr:universal stress protein [Ruegeria pomeroyi]MCE8509776.1 universal stress protein [Ruegeria pomeroyi]